MLTFHKEDDEVNGSDEEDAEKSEDGLDVLAEGDDADRRSEISIQTEPKWYGIKCLVKTFRRRSFEGFNLHGVDDGLEQRRPVT